MTNRLTRLTLKGALCLFGTVICLEHAQQGNAQVFIEFSVAPSGIRTPSDMCNVSINNMGGMQLEVYGEFELTEEKAGSIVKLRTQNFILQPGISQFNYERFRMSPARYGGSSTAQQLRSSGMLGQGNYTLCFVTRNPQDDYDIQRNCISFTVSGDAPQPGSTDRLKQPGKNFTFGGYSEVTGVFNTRPSNYSSLPPYYMQAILNPDLTVNEVPIGARITLSTLQSSTMQNINTFSLYFDGDQFREMLKKKLTEQVEKNNAIRESGLTDLSSSMSQLTMLQNTLKNPIVIREMLQIKELDSLRTVYEQVRNGSTEELVSVVADSLSPDSYRDNKKINALMDSSKVLRTAKDLVSDGNTDKLMDAAKDSVSSDTGVATVSDSLSQLKKTAESLKNDLPTDAASLQKRILELEWLDKKREGYDKLVAKKERMMETARQFGLVDSAGNIKDVNSLKEAVDYKQLSNPAFLYEKLRSSKLLRKADKILFGFRTISFGTSNPNFSELSLRNVPVNGLLVEYEQYGIYAGFSYGDLLAASNTYDLDHASYSRRVLAGSFGYGSKQKTHFHVNIVHAKDDSTSIQPRDSVFLYQKSPKENYVISADFKLLLLKDQLRISGEFAGAQTTRDLSYQGTNIINPAVTNDPSEWFVNIFTQRDINTNTAVDFAFNGKVEALLFKGKTTVSAAVKRIGANYYAFGTPFMMRDLFSVESKVTQKFWKNRISAMAFIRRNNDNLDGQKPLSSEFYNYGFDVSFAMPKLPFFRASFMPLNLQNDSARFDMVMLNVTAGHNYKITKGVNANSMLTYTYQDSRSEDTAYTGRGHYVMLSQQFSFPKNVSLNLTANYFRTENDTLTRNTINIGAGTGFSLFGIISNSIGGNIYFNHTELRWGAYYQAAATFLKYFSVSVRIENNQYNNYIFQPGNPDYLQVMGRTVLSARW